MSLIRLRAEHVRCLERVELESADKNLIFGENASGKTSLLEAIFILGRGRSFRGPGRTSVISDGSDRLMVSGLVSKHGRKVPVGIALSRSGSPEIRIDGESAEGLASLTEWIPVQIIDPQIHSLVDEGPGVRRRYMDWGVFHVEHRFLDVWRRYQRALRQRNAFLRSGRGGRLDVWDEQIVEAGLEITAMRQRYVDAIRPFVNRVAGVLLQSEPSIDYRCGWASGKTFADALEESRSRDKRFGVTHVGSHRSDLALHLEERSARGRVSRGQQKLLAATLVLGQLEHLIETTGIRPVLLLDDLPAELDGSSLRRVLSVIRDLPAQQFVTALDEGSVDLPEPLSVFHVEQGKVRAVV
jgi:DNA replication and repair protein RecF